MGFDLNPLHTFFGDAGFSFDASDGVTSQTLRAEVTVTEVNDVPVAVDDEFLNGIEDQSYQFTLADLTSNDSDVEGDAFSITSLTNLNPESGALNVDLAAGTAGFVPNADFNGEVRFSYILTETATGIESQANGRVVFAAQDDTAALSDKSFTINEDEVTLFGNAMLLDVLQDADGEVFEHYRGCSR